MTDSIGDFSEDGYWVLTEDGWQPTEKQKLALSEGATPHDSEAIPQQVLIHTDFSHQDLYPDRQNIFLSDNVKSYVSAGIMAFGLILLLFGMHLDSWTNTNEYDPDEDVSWVENAEGGMGLTEITMDCSEVTGTDPETGEKNKDMCKFAFGLFTGEISVSQIGPTTTVVELADDLPDEMSGSISVMCETMVELESSSEEITYCEDRSAAGSTAIILFWLSFCIGLIALVMISVSIFHTIPHSEMIQKISSCTSTSFAIIGFIYWLIMAPVFDSEAPFGGAFYLTIFSLLILIASTIMIMIKPSENQITRSAF